MHLSNFLKIVVCSNRILDETVLVRGTIAVKSGGQTWDSKPMANLEFRHQSGFCKRSASLPNLPTATKSTRNRNVIPAVLNV